MKFVRIASFDSYPVAAMLVQRLAEAGFHPQPVSESEFVGVAGVNRGFEIRVPDDERVAATAFLAAEKD